MNDRISRREALRKLAFSTAALLPASLLACKSKPSCNDVSGLSPEEVNARVTSAGYVEHAPDPAKKCNNCIHFVPAAPNACGSCKIVKGPIDAEAYCKLWTAKPA
jgi:hypothetical protein